METQLSFFVKGMQDGEEKLDGVELDHLWGTWLFISRFLAITWISYFLQEDYDTPDLDQEVNDFLYGKTQQGNEFLELSAKISQHFKSQSIARQPMFQSMANVDYHAFKLLASPVSQHGENQSVIEQILRKKLLFMARELAFFADSRYVIRFASDLAKAGSSVFNEKATLLKSGELAFSTGEVFPSPLFPFLLFEENGQGSLSTLLFTKWKDRTDIYTNYCYVHAIQGAESGVQFHGVRLTEHDIGIRDPNIISTMFKMHDNIAENPYFNHILILDNPPVKIKLRFGNILNLNSYARKNTENKYVVALVPSSDQHIQTTMMNHLRLVGENECVDEILSRPKQEGEVYELVPRCLDFHRFLFCPIYNIERNDRPDIDVIKKTISNLINHLQADKSATHLICPAFGAHWGEGMRQEVPNLWLDAIKIKGGLGSVHTIIFSFIETTTLIAYKQTFLKKIGHNKLEAQLSRLEAEYHKIREEKKAVEHELDAVKKNLKETSRFSFLPHSLAQRMNDLSQLESFGSDYDFVREALHHGLLFLRISAAIFLRLALEIKKQDQSKKICKVLNHRHEEIVKYSEEKISNDNKFNLEHGPFIEICKPLFKVLCDELQDWKRYSENMQILKNFFQPKKGSLTLAKIRNKISHSEFSKGHPFYTESRNNIIKNIRLQDSILSAFYMNKMYYELIHIDEFGGTDNEDIEEFKIVYTSLCGSTGHTKERMYIEGNLPNLQNNRVYLKNNISQGLNLIRMDPFILYLFCPKCNRTELMVWKGFLNKKPVYQGCYCAYEYNEENCLKENTYNGICQGFWRAINKMRD